MKKAFLRRCAFIALRATLLPFVLRELCQRVKVTILAYHAPSPEVFEAHLECLKHLYNIVSLTTYVEARLLADFGKLPPKALIITLDDGHRSNYALKPILERHNVPVTVFLCSGLIDTHRRFWFLHDHTRSIVQRLKAVSDTERLAILRNAGFEETKEFDDRQALSAAEVTDLKLIADLQSHTVFHPILPLCTARKAKREIGQSRSDLQARLGAEVYAFAYPNGDYSERELRLVEKAGYRCALTMDEGFNSQRTPLFKLRRISVTDSADRHELIVKASGLWTVVRSLFKNTL